MKSNDVLEHLVMFATLFVFGLCLFIAILATSFCVPKNFNERTSPLRAYRKVIRFRLLFDSIRSPKRGQKGFQPEEENPTWDRGLVGNFEKKKVALGNAPLGRFWHSARANFEKRAIQFAFQAVTHLKLPEIVFCYTKLKREKTSFSSHLLQLHLLHLLLFSPLNTHQSFLSLAFGREDFISSTKCKD